MKVMLIPAWCPRTRSSHKARMQGEDFQAESVWWEFHSVDSCNVDKGDTRNHGNNVWCVHVKEK